MTVDIGITFIIIILSIIGFTRQNLRSDYVALMAMSLLLVTGVLKPTEAIQGFSNEATITVACMFAISAAVIKSGLVNYITGILSKFLKFGFIPITLIIMFFTAVLSSFLNNTAIVAIFLPVALNIASDLNVDKRKILMPLSFAAIVGGTCTLVGTSTNILVNSIYKRAGYDGFRMFDFSMIGAILAVGVIIYLVFIGLRFLTKKPLEDVPGRSLYITTIIINEDFQELGLKYTESELMQVIGSSFNEVQKNNDVYDTFDELTFNIDDHIKIGCDIEKIKKLNLIKGISFLTTEASEKLNPDMNIFEVVIPKESPIVGKSLHNLLHFRGFNIVPLAIQKAERFIFHKVRDSIMTPGDQLVVATNTESQTRLDHELNLKFTAVHELNAINPRFLTIVILVLCGFMITTAFEILSALQAAILSVSALLITRTLSLDDVYEALDSQVLMLLASILSLGLALEKTGASQLLGDFLVTVSVGQNEYILVGVIFLITTLITAIMSNAATAALLTPIVISMSKTLSVSEKPLLLAVMLGASMSFMTPIGYQTNTMIYSAGGFTFKDFMRVGLVVNLVTVVIGTYLILEFFPLK
ncbi:MAG: hypothetical protein CME62_13415 [Halobacteriovoraceae bacterium]|nr:hypothetical protein [Halobacteriovoraceae bacterium]|tara:strand:- start:856 stop:2613 length:1758 start_codon:yes stop_codon:yes gene_type:complete